MSLPQNLLDLSWSLLPSDNQRGRPNSAALKRCISTAYYSVFSLVVHAGATMLAGSGSDRKLLRGYVARDFEHGGMAEACKGFAAGNLNKRLKPCLPVVSASLIEFAKILLELRQSRHEADYNILQKPTKTEAKTAVDDATRAFGLWQTIKGTAEERVFLLAVLMDDRLGKKGR